MHCQQYGHRHRLCCDRELAKKLEFFIFNIHIYKIYINYYLYKLKNKIMIRLRVQM